MPRLSGEIRSEPETINTYPQEASGKCEDLFSDSEPPGLHEGIETERGSQETGGNKDPLRYPLPVGSIGEKGAKGTLCFSFEPVAAPRTPGDTKNFVCIVILHGKLSSSSSGKPAEGQGCLGSGLIRIIRRKVGLIKRHNTELRHHGINSL